MSKLGVNTLLMFCLLFFACKEISNTTAETSQEIEKSTPEVVEVEKPTSIEI